MHWFTERPRQPVALHSFLRDKLLAYFPEELLKCVTFVGYKDQHGEHHLSGSGFWVSRADPNDTGQTHRLAYFVTAAHVIDKVRESSADQRVWLRVNTKNAGQTWQDTPEAIWKHHPHDVTVDLAVAKMGIEARLDHAAWPLESLVANNNLDTPQTGDRKVELGDELCIAGLFHPHKGEKRNIPLVRIANVAALRDEPVTNKDGAPMDVYLAEVHSMGGLSGSPVFVDIATAKTAFPPSSGWMAAAYPPASLARFKLFGIVHGHFGGEVDPDAIVEDGKRKLAINFGIAMVIPAEKICEILTQFDQSEKHQALNDRPIHRYDVAAGGAGAGANSTIGLPFGGAGTGANSTTGTPLDPSKYGPK